ncbi:PEP-CTERM sorting domain-containing protein [Coraliomargarita algicola]|uniref:PEP-CTERM sorting domain-containing protein n=1 Tax=Coraliomargarita algicola TaxID=3092156 RepID=A0ABZ0RRX1_9BACT|nr:PEP-CTERM sorting domain-containing protein [Coraliomargarita sp. J2-16]WPJ97735.1 PEP-CTERM sorting domain-containing protein [Coraliomargarita sp. J2-16]
MKIKATIVGLCAVVCAASSGLANVSMDFTNINFTAITAATEGSGAVIGSQYLATGVADLEGAGGVGVIDAIFTISDASVDDSSLIYFANEGARGDDARIRLEKNSSADIWVKISISFVLTGTSTAVDVADASGSDLRLQFDDLDSDVNANRADYAGLVTAEADLIELASNTELVTNTSLHSGYSVGLYPSPYGPKGNITSTDAIAQSPVTIGFDSTAEVLDIVVGVTGSATGSRHIDIDMTPDFIIVPEPSSYALLIGAISLGFVSLRRRR